MSVGISIEVRENQSITTIDWWSIAGFVIPDFEVRDLAPFDIGYDAQGQKAAAFQAQGIIEARSTLLDHSKMKCRRVCDRLDLIGRVRGLIFYRNCRPVDDIDRLREGITEIGIAGAAIANKPTRIHVQMCKVRQPWALDRRNGAAWQVPEHLQIYWLPAHLDQECVEKILMTELVSGVLINVRRHVLINALQRVSVRAVSIDKVRILLP